MPDNAGFLGHSRHRESRYAQRFPRFSTPFLSGAFAWYGIGYAGREQWDHFDFREQPFDFTPYGSAGKNQPDSMKQGANYNEKIYGVEYLCRITTCAPDGSISKGSGQVELFINGAYNPYGFR